MWPWGPFTPGRTAALANAVLSFRVQRAAAVSSPGRAYLDVDITLSSEAFHSYLNAALAHVNKALKLVVRLFLVEDLVDSLKVGAAAVLGGGPRVTGRSCNSGGRP